MAKSNFVPPSDAELRARGVKPEKETPVKESTAKSSSKKTAKSKE